MNETELLFASIDQIAAHYRAGTLSPVAVTEWCLARIAALNPTLNAFITVTAESAMASAREAEQAFRAGCPCGRLQGIPVALKDLANTANGGAKAILCEKPIATTLADADRMIAAAETNQVLLSIEDTRSCSLLFLKERELICSGEFGLLRGITANMYSTRSMLFRNGTYLIGLRQSAARCL